MANLKIATINVRGLRNKVKRSRLLNWLKVSRFHIICLQETFITYEIDQEISNEFYEFGLLFNCCSTSVHSKGVSILISHDIGKYNAQEFYKSNDGRQILLHLKIDGVQNDFVISSVYAPNDIKGKINFLKEVNDLVKTHNKNNPYLVIAGDLNTCYNVIDRASGSIDKSGYYLKELIESNGLVDIYRCMNPDKKSFPYIHPTIPSRNSRIDYVLVSENVQKYVNTCNIICCPVPDHKAVTPNLYLTEKRGKGYWKLNNSLLADQIYIDLIKSEITKTLSEYNGVITKQQMFELIKVKVKELRIAYSINKARSKKCRILQLEKAIDVIDSKLTKNNTAENLLLERQNIKLKLSELYNERTKAAFIRSHSKWIEEGEKNSSYFLALESHRQANNCIDTLLGENGQMANTDKDILKTITNFYTNLYSSKNPKISDINDYLRKCEVKKKLSREDSDSCEGFITNQECKYALNSMKTNKSPGLDGLTVEFYRTFWDILSQVLLDSYNEAFWDGSLSDSRNIVVMSLIFKKNDRSDIQNYRPITLANIDYKILAFVLANRL